MSRYSLRTKNSPIYTDLPAHQKLAGKTSDYKPYEEIGLVKKYNEKVYNRYGNLSLSEAILDFLYTHKEFFPIISYIIEHVKDRKYLLDSNNINYDQEVLLDHVLFNTLNQSYVKVKECLKYENITSEEDYIKKIKHLQCATDFILLFLKYNSVCQYGREKVEHTLKKCYATTRSLSIEFREYKQREYDRQHVALLHKTKLPTDICNYVIKEFL